MFIYGGCKGNSNNFNSALECHQTCGGDAPVIGKRHTDVAVSEPEQDEAPQCTAASVWKDKCNTCRCSSKGKALCTERACPPGASEEDGICEGDSRWKKDCNWCSCVNGRGVCTLRACITRNRRLETVPSISQDHVSDEDTECVDGSRWKNECNWCSCNNGIAACTLKACLPGSSEEDGVCEGTSRWKKDCNWCSCENGRGVCTARACATTNQGPETVPPSSPGHVSDEDIECTEGSRWKNDCSWCSCRNGIGACTLIACLPGFRRISNETECEENSRWKKDCNWCSCQNGRAVCTRMACTQRLIAPPAEEKHCTDGDTWQEDCNDCTCIEGRRECTQKNCAEETSVPEHCLLPPEIPSELKCLAAIESWTYNRVSGTCEKYIYSGCGATENLFGSEEECRKSCSLTQDVTPKDQCQQPIDSGPCFASFVRYAFSSERNRCEMFIYGGCKGNSNNFNSALECHQTCGGDAHVIVSDCDRTQCPWEHFQHYFAKGCGPVYEGGSCCPTQFSCPVNETSEMSVGTCRYKGLEYSIGEDVPVSNPCSVGCKCSSFDNSTEIRCAEVECPSLFMPSNPGCRRLYRPNECCSYKEECDDHELAVLRQHTCYYEDQTYLNGDRMSFDEEPCQTCVCGPDFSGPFGPGCSKVDCGFEFRYQRRYDHGCTPVFFENRCCAIGWVCPGDGQLTEDHNITDTASASSYCTLGDIVVPLGSRATTDDCKLVCSCLVPPELTCIQFSSCESSGTHLQQRSACKPPRCPEGCSPQMDLVLGCPSCSCSDGFFLCPPVACSDECRNPQIVFNESTGCRQCKCECVTGPDGKPPCPMDCAIRYITDMETGCEICDCDPSNTDNPFIQPSVRIQPHENLCLIDTTTGKPPCPVDCPTIFSKDNETGCDVCVCDQDDQVPLISACPNHPSTVLDSCPDKCYKRKIIVGSSTGCLECHCECLVEPDGKPPCPMDCAVRYITDQETGCEVCECDPSNTSNPFVPSFEINGKDCLVDPTTGQPPCPMDCAIRYITDPETGCEICECDPNDTSNPFIKPSFEINGKDCLVDPTTGQPPCPMDCAIRYITDPETGCEICECDPNDTSNPFIQPSFDI